MSGSAGNDKIGSALVIGGGIGGMQAALDLAESGIKVYLADTKSCIGGVMSQLDKTFPTNDCAMCTMAPRLVEIGRHKDIEIITLADVESLEGQPGNFKVTLKKRARYIDEEKCTGCGLCTEKCPVRTDSEFDLGLASRKAVYRSYPQAVPGTFAIDKRGVSPCRLACPLDVNAHAYVTLIAQGRFAEALEVQKRRNPFPAICGRVCTHPCESECRRGELDEPVSIFHLKRFLADWEMKAGKLPPPEIKEKREEQVAIIGSGPAGLSAARELAIEGYKVTVFEKQPVAGGMLAWGIPAYRLPRDILNMEIDSIRDLGVEIKTNTPIGPDLTLDDLRKRGYKGIFVAIGATRGLTLDIPGEDEFQGVMDCVDFLARFNLGREVSVGKKVAVIGGGNAAVDAARTALRLGADEVTIVYRRTRKEMPANPPEIEDALEEGVKIHFLAAPVGIRGEKGNVAGLECVRMELGPPDASGRRRPIPSEGSNFVIDVDTVIPAISQAPDIDSLPAGHSLNLNKWNSFDVDPITLQSNQADVFAGGDAVTGPATVVKAIAAGQRAAESIHRYLRGIDLKEGREEERERIKALKDISGIQKQNRQEMPKLSMEERKGSFDEVELGFTEEMAVEEAKRCLNCAGCCECLYCAEACEAKAVIHEMEPEKTVELNVGAVIVSPGFELFDANKKLEYGYWQYPNVVTALEFERILNASGPYEGKVLRPSDKTPPRKMAFIQCFGSRDKDRDYCSSICCMYATKEAIIAKEHSHEELECHVYFMDMRAFGKGFEEYYERAKELGVKYIRCRPSSIEQVNGNNLKIRHITDDGKVLENEYDLVVLSSGLEPAKSVKDLSQKLDIKLNEKGFCHTDIFRPTESNREGVFVCGPFTGPKDIPETVMQASGAASKALSLLSDVRGSLIKPKEYPPERDVRGEAPRIGVFVCHCGTNIAGVVNVPEVVEYVKSLPDVVYAENNLYTCSNDTQEKMKELIEEHKLNRVIVASCTPRTHEPLFRNSIREAGLNSYLFEMANIRDQCSWVHMHEPEKATQKSKDLVRMAVAKARMIQPLYSKLMPVKSGALVIGGGMSGMTAALNLADQGFEVNLVEKEAELGGNLRHVHYLLDGEDPRKELADTIKKVENHPNIKAWKDTKIAAIEGFIGNFKTRVEKRGEETEFEHGVVIVATGAKENTPDEYMYGSDDRVITQRELEEKLAKGDFNAKRVVMIQCVGSREGDRMYCSRICCSQAVKNALKIKENHPDTDVYVLYREIRTYGFRESHYTEARKKGIRFVRYSVENKPVVSSAGERLKVETTDSILKGTLDIDCDMVVLAPAIVPHEDAENIAKMLKVPLTREKFFLEAHMKLRPIDFATDGVFLCGLAHSPKPVDESIAQAMGAASRAATVLSKKEMELEAAISEVIDANCDGCAYCIDPCPYNALTLIEYMKEGAIKKTVERNEALCKGCGVCMATCPKSGIFVRNFKLEQLEAMIEAALESA